MEAVLFFVAAIGALGGAIGVVAMRNPFYGVLALIVHLFAPEEREYYGLERLWSGASEVVRLV